MTGELIIRAAHEAESSRLSELARASKASWGYPPEWLAAWHDDLCLSPEYIQGNDVLVAELDGELVGVVGIGDGADGPEIGHLWVAAGAQGKGVGAALLREGIAVARTRGWTELRIESDPHAQPFYEHFGATHQGEVPAPVCGVDRTLPLLRLPV